MARMTVRGIEALKPKEGSYKVTVDRGLYLRIAPDGTKTWLVRYVVAGHQIQMRLPRPYGSNGDNGSMSLAQAVAENARIQSLAREGIDVQIQRAEAELSAAEAKAASEAANVPLRALLETWLADGVSRKDGNAALRRAFEKDVLPFIGDIPIRSIGDTHVLDVLRKVGRTRGRGRTAECMLADMRQMFRWALKRQPWRSLLHHGNPAESVDLKQVVSPGYERVIRERTLSPEEIRELRNIFVSMATSYEAAANKRVADRPVQQTTQLALWICLGTGCRIGELLQARWEHVDLEKSTWFVPRENTKTHVDWQVYLSEFALKQFKALHKLNGRTEWCFPASQNKGHVFIKSVSKQVGDRQTQFKDRKPLECVFHAIADSVPR